MKLEQRVFLIVHEGQPVARLRSQGAGSEMFWEGFRVEPLHGDAAALQAHPLWLGAVFDLRHEASGLTVEHVFSAGRPPYLQSPGCLAIELRGTGKFRAPAPAVVAPVPWWSRLFGKR